jgi:hypothetical protein
MKAKTFKLFMILAGIVILFTLGCKKNEKNTNSNIQMQPSPQNQIDLKLIRIVTNFIKQGTLQLKDGRDVSVDSAIWYLGECANFTYGKASQQRDKIVIDTTSITLTVTNGSISLNEVWNKYEDMIDSIKACYQLINSKEKQLIAVAVQNSSLTSTELVCRVVPIFSFGGMSSDPCYFNNVDYWTWWNISGTGGICDGPNQNQGGGKDAAMLINEKIMRCMGVPIGNYYYDSQLSVDLFPESFSNPNWNGIDYNYERYRMYWNHSSYSDFHGCLSPSECNFYRDGTEWIATVSQSSGGARPDGFSLISIAIHGDMRLDYPNQGDSKYFHWGPVFYGILHWNPNPPVPF